MDGDGVGVVLVDRVYLLLVVLGVVLIGLRRKQVLMGSFGQALPLSPFLDSPPPSVQPKVAI